MDTATIIILFALIGSLVAARDSKNCDVKIEIDPERSVALIDETVNISCHVIVKVKDIVLMSITRDDNEPIAVIRQGSNNVSYGNKNVFRYQAEGRIDQHAKRKYLRLTLLHPRTEDTGVYTCAVVYFDQSVAFKQDKASSNLTVHSEVDNKRLEIILTHLLAKVTRLETENGQLWKGINKLSNAESAMSGRMTNHSNQLAALTDKAAYTSAFSATVARDTYIRNGQIVIFPTVITSVGVGYNRTTGVYTAPRRGIYAFHFGFMVGYVDRGAYISINKDDKQLVSVHAFDSRGYFDHSSCSTVVLLEPGDRVTVVVIHAYKYAPIVRNYWRLSVFSGYLINLL